MLILSIRVLNVFTSDWSILANSPISSLFIPLSARLDRSPLFTLSIRALNFLIDSTIPFIIFKDIKRINSNTKVEITQTKISIVNADVALSFAILSVAVEIISSYFLSSFIFEVIVLNQ